MGWSPGGGGGRKGNGGSCAVGGGQKDGSNVERPMVVALLR